MKKTNDNKSFRGRALWLASAALVALIVAPTVGNAANLSSAPFFVKAQNSADSTHFAVRPFLKAAPVASAPTATATASAAPTATPSPVATILSTYNFETASDFTRWSGAARSGSSSPRAHSGNGYLYYSYSTKGPYYESPPSMVYEVGKTYQVTAWVYNESGYNANTQLVAQRDAASSSPVITATNSWTQVSVTFVAKTTTPSINFVGNFPSNSGFMRIDDVTISQIS